MPISQAHEVLLAVRAARGAERLRALRRGAETLGDEILTAWLRDGADDVRRNAALEMLKLRMHRSFATAVQLLGDEDPDVVLQAVLLLDSIGDTRAWRHLQPLLHSQNLNVVQAVIAAAPRAGTRQACNDLLLFLNGDFWLQMAAINSLGLLRARAAVPHLIPLLGRMQTAEFAAEALCRIGGKTAAAAVVRFWRSHPGALDPERWLPLLAELIASAAKFPPDAPFRHDIIPYFEHDIPEVANAAATIVLALGPGEGDDEAIRVLVHRQVPGQPVPAVLTSRSDLIPRLLRAAPPARDWAYEIANLNLASISPEELISGLREAPTLATGAVMRIAERVRDGSVLVRAFLDADEELRPALASALLRHPADIVQALRGEFAGSAADRAILLDYSGAPPATVREAVAALPASERRAAVIQLRSQQVVESLPWREWLLEDREGTAPILAALAVRFELSSALPMLREMLRCAPGVEVIEAVAALRDKESLPLLVAHLQNGKGPALRAHLFGGIARIGGPASLELLRDSMRSGQPLDARLAAHAVARMRGSSAHARIVAEMALHPDWAVRLSAVEALSEISGSEARRALDKLAADESDAVSGMARTVIASRRGART